MSVMNKLVNVCLQFLFPRAFIHKPDFVKYLHKLFVLLVLFSDTRNQRGDSHTLGFNQQKSQLSFAETKSSKDDNTDNNTST